MNYSASHPDAVTEYRRIRMILHIYSYASYISEPEAHIRLGRYFFVSPKSSNNTLVRATPLENGPVHVEYSIMRNVMTSATETELGEFLENFQKETSMRTDL